jgi:hypothetical protein
MDFARASDGGDKGWFELAAETAHFGESEFEYNGHVLTGHVSRGKDKFTDGIRFQRAFFEEVVANAFVGCQQYPTV